METQGTNTVYQTRLAVLVPAFSRLRARVDFHQQEYEQETQERVEVELKGRRVRCRVVRRGAVYDGQHALPEHEDGPQLEPLDRLHARLVRGKRMV